MGSFSTSGEAARKGPGMRRVARDLALRLLFQHDSSGTTPENTALAFEANFSPEQDDENCLEINPNDFARSWSLAQELFLGVRAHVSELDAGISRAADNWTLARMTPVDRSLIRLAYFEMIYREEIPRKVSLNEALELSKSYGDDDSTAFINGVLDRLMRRLEAEN